MKFKTKYEFAKWMTEYLVQHKSFADFSNALLSEKNFIRISKENNYYVPYDEVYMFERSGGDYTYMVYGYDEVKSDWWWIFLSQINKSKDTNLHNIRVDKIERGKLTGMDNAKIWSITVSEKTQFINWQTDPFEVKS